MELNKIYKQEEVRKLYEVIKEKNPLTKFTFGANSARRMYYRFGNYEYFETDEEYKYICTRTPEGESDQRNLFFKKNNSERLDHKQAGYWTRTDSATREAKKIEKLREEGKLSNNPLK